MKESLVIAAILLLCGVIAWLRPQWIAALRKNPQTDPRIIRRIVGGIPLLMALLIAGGSWLLERSGYTDDQLSILRIGVLFIGLVAVISLVEHYKKKNRR